MGDAQPLRLLARPVDAQTALALEQAGVHPLLAHLLAGRGATRADRPGAGDLAGLLPPDGLRGVDNAATVLADYLLTGRRVTVVGDYDCDGATATAVAVSGLRSLAEALGWPVRDALEKIDFLVPNRFEYGYGLSPEIVRLAHQRQPDLLVTVDNGIASVEGVAEAHRLGVNVVITDHHLPGDALPAALAIVNPNQPGCTFPSKCIAGVGVMFYVLLAVRAELRRRGVLDTATQPRLDDLLDLVALGTVADVVRLDANNRLLVAQGLKRIRAGRLRPGLAALFHVAGRHARSASTGDLGFSIGPRLNAAGRLADMRIGIQTLLCDDPGRALELARTLDAMNRDRQTIESTMKDDALALLDGFEPQQAGTVVLQHPAWHQGVIGIVASRIKDQYFRPTIAFAPGDAGEWKGSGRSVPGVHLRDALDLVVKRLPAGSIPKFGGHAMAAGLTIKDHALAAFRVCFDAVVRDLIGPAGLERRFEHDGSLALAYCNAHTAELLAAEVWGQGFPPPVFVDTFEVLSQRLLKDAHSKLQLRRDGATFTALWWRHTEAVAARLRVAYRIERDDFNGNGAVQLIVEHATAA